MNLPRLMGYADRISVRPGETIRFKVSADGIARYQADIVRLVCAADVPGGPGFDERPVESPVSGEYPGRVQPIHAGSYVRVPATERTQRLASFTAQAFVWPTLPGHGTQAILGTWSQGLGAGFALVVEEDGTFALRVGTSGGALLSVSTGHRLAARAWTFVAATYDAASRQAVLVQGPLDPATRPARPIVVGAKLDGARADGGRDLLIAAWNASQRPGQAPTGAHFNGRVEAPRLADRALEFDAIEALGKPIPPLGLGQALLGCWDFARDIGSTRVVDVGPGGWHGATVNLPTRAVRGHRWTGAEMNWRYAPEQYAAIHFHDDDLYDCGWGDDVVFTVPADLPSGCYAARLIADDAEERIPFIVRPPAGRASAPVLFVMPTATHMAYANGAKALDDEATEVAKGGFTVVEAREAALAVPALGGSLYDHHRDGSGVHHASRMRPMLDARPRTELWTFDADTLIPAWLAAIGQPADMATDEDLDAEGAALLAPYRVVLTGRQPEYVSTRMRQGYADYLGRGGRLMYLGGNGFYWRIAFHPELPGVIEVRRPEGGVRAWSSAPGEGYHAFSGEPGGLWRRLGRPPNTLVGVGFTAQGFDGSRPYRRLPGADDPRAAFAFAGVTGPEIGAHGLLGNGAAGVEIDRFDLALGSPRHALVLARADGFSANWRRVTEEFLTLHPMIDGASNDLVRADLVFFETPAGGAVFAVGSIAWTAALATDGYANDVARVTANVLRRFLDAQPFAMPDPDAVPITDPDSATVGAADVAEGLRRRP